MLREVAQSSIAKRAGIRAAAQWLGWFFAITIALAIWRSEVISLPPYEDQAVGLWNEADFLVENDFDYHKLRYEEPLYMSKRPGARSYVISLLPTLVALLIESTPTAAASFVVAHWVTFALTAGILLFVFACLRPVTGALIAALAALALLTTPLFSAQVDLLGMDIPLTMFAMLTAWAVWRERYLVAAVASLGAFLMKATGGLLTVATLIFLTARLVIERGRVSRFVRRQQIVAIVAHLVVLAAEIAIFSIGDTTASVRSAIPWPKMLQLPYAFAWLPDIGVLLFLWAGLCLWAVGTWLYVEKSTGESEDPASDDDGAARRRGIAIAFYCWLVVCGMLAANAMYIFIPRYFTAALPFLYIAVSTLLAVHLRAKWAAVSLLGLMLGINLLNQYGQLYPALERVDQGDFARYPWFHARQCALSERSREYLHDHRANLQAVEQLVERCGNDPIFVTAPQSFYLTKPRLGYVDRPLKVFDIVDYEIAVPSFVHWVMSNAEASTLRPIFIWRGKNRMTVPPPHENDEIIYADSGEPPMMIYRKTLPASARASARAAERWYLDQTLKGPFFVERVEMRAIYLVESGQVDRGMREIVAASNFDPEHPRIRGARYYVFGAWEKRARDVRTSARGRQPPDGIEPTFPTIARIEPRLTTGLKTLLRSRDLSSRKRQTSSPSTDSMSPFAAAQSAMLARRWQLASAYLAVSQFAEPTLVRRELSQFSFAMLLAAQGSTDDAADQFAALVEEFPYLPEAYHRFGLARLEQGRLGEARKALDRAIDLDPQFVAAHYALGLTLGRAREYLAAQDHLIEAVWLEPGNRDALRSLMSALDLRPPTEADNLETAGDIRPKSRYASVNLAAAQLPVVPPRSR